MTATPQEDAEGDGTAGKADLVFFTNNNGRPF
jgi:hypothetical protein